MTTALEGSEWSAARSGRTLPPGMTRYPFYRRLGGPQGRSGRAEKLVPTGIRSRTVQPVAQSLYRLSYPVHSIYTYSYFNNAVHRFTMTQSRQCHPCFGETCRFSSQGQGHFSRTCRTHLRGRRYLGTNSRLHLQDITRFEVTYLFLQGRIGFRVYGVTC